MNSMTRAVNLMGVAGLACVMTLAAAGCEKKEPAPTPPPPTSGQGATDAAKDAMDSAGKAVSETAAKAGEAVKEAAAAITDQAKAAMSDYLSGLGDANSIMEKLTSALDVPANMPALNDAAKKVNTNSAILGALPDAEKAAIKDANKDQLGSLTAKFKEHMNKLTSGDLGKMVGDTLNSFKLFE